MAKDGGDLGRVLAPRGGSETDGNLSSFRGQACDDLEAAYVQGEGICIKKGRSCAVSETADIGKTFHANNWALSSWP